MIEFKSIAPKSTPVVTFSLVPLLDKFIKVRNASDFCTEHCVHDGSLVSSLMVSRDQCWRTLANYWILITLSKTVNKNQISLCCPLSTCQAPGLETACSLGNSGHRSQRRGGLSSDPHLSAPDLNTRFM